MAGTLILEAIVVLLALPVVSMVGGGLSAWSTAYLVGFAVFLVLLAGVQGRPYAIWLNLAVQFILVAGFFVYPAVGMVGLLFVVVWAILATCALRSCAGSAAACCPASSNQVTDGYAVRRERANPGPDQARRRPAAGGRGGDHQPNRTQRPDPRCPRAQAGQ